MNRSPPGRRRSRHFRKGPFRRREGRAAGKANMSDEALTRSRPGNAALRQAAAARAAPRPQAPASLLCATEPSRLGTGGGSPAPASSLSDRPPSSWCRARPGPRWLLPVAGSARWGIDRSHGRASPRRAAGAERIPPGSRQSGQAGAPIFHAAAALGCGIGSVSS
jgi:hypothetical protein